MKPFALCSTLFAFALALFLPPPSYAQPSSAPAVATQPAPASTPTATAKPPAVSIVHGSMTEVKASPSSLPAVDPNNPGEILGFIYEAFRTGKVAWAIGLILTLLTWLFNALLKYRIPDKFVPWIAIALGVALNVAMSFAAGVPWHTALSNGLSMGLAAVGGWEALLKRFRKKPETESAISFPDDDKTPQESSPAEPPK